MKILAQFIFFPFFCTLLACSGAAEEKEKAPAQSAPPKTNKTTPQNTSKQKSIVVFGNSLTAGYGLEDSESDSYAGVIQQKINQLGKEYKVVNSGLSGETTAGGEDRIDWILDRQPMDIFVLELGGNDALRGFPVEETYENLDAIIKKVKAKDESIEIILAGMQAPPNMGGDYIQDFADVYPRLAEKHNIKLVPFLLEGVGGVPQLNQPDGIHPTKEGHQILADNVWNILAPLL